MAQASKRSSPAPGAERMGLRLYLRIWLAVLLAVATLTLLVGWAWRMAADPPLREIVVRDSASGQIVGSGQRHYGRYHGEGAVRSNRADPGSAAERETKDTDDEAGTPRGPHFNLTMQDGRELSVHLPRPPRSHSWRAPFGFFWTLGLVAVAVALATYPIIRKLTRRLEQLQQGVEQWGSGALGTRVPVQGRDEVAFLAQRFNTAAERIETLVNSHKSLLANASHELRSPLARIRMGLELMAPASSASDQQARTELRRNIAELDQLIDEILLASRLDVPDAPMGTPELVDLIGLAAEECARVDAQLEGPQLAEPLELPAVARLLRRALRNLLENARRYSSGSITLTLQRDNQWALVQVCDQGPGVPPAERERIFEPCYRLAGASERDGGVGLGLALVRTIALRHGGSVRCTARPDGSAGACFELRLPLA